MKKFDVKFKRGDVAFIEYKKNGAPQFSVITFSPDASQIHVFANNKNYNIKNGEQTKAKMYGYYNSTRMTLAKQQERGSEKMSDNDFDILLVYTIPPNLKRSIAMQQKVFALYANVAERPFLVYSNKNISLSQIQHYQSVLDQVNEAELEKAVSKTTSKKASAQEDLCCGR